MLSLQSILRPRRRLGAVVALAFAASPAAAADLPVPQFHWIDARPMFFTERHGNPGTRIPGVPWPMLRSTPPERPGALQRDPDHPGVWRFETTAQDVIGNGNGSFHNELQAAFPYSAPPRGQSLAGAGGTVNGRDYWVSYAFLVEPGPPNQNRWFIIGQWHATEDNAFTAPDRAPDDAVSPPLCLNLTAGDHLEITSRTDPKPQTLVAQYPEERVEWADPAPLVRGVWRRVVLHVRFGWAGDGRLEAWIDGTKRVSRTHDYSIGYNDMVGPHWNWGAYRGWWADGRANDQAPLAVVIAHMEVSERSLRRRVDHPLGF